ncbi:glycosyltransferase family 8 protein [Oleiharenicola lentus]|uniref:glycosyltransferase family 8 protein n=1 Tax=Oleiharenicola lentus TaxID=2508720 RepID=UPI003F66C72E
MPTPVIHLAMQSDQNYADGLVATLCGVAKHLPTALHASVWVIDCGIHPSTRKELETLIADRLPNLTLHFLSIEAEVLDRFPFPVGLQHANRSVYARIFLPQLLPTVDRILYLDCDLLVDTDVSALAALPLHGALVAAAVDVEMKPENDIRDFNSGVMLMDLAAMRTEQLTERAVTAAGENNTRHGDQTLLNELLRGRWVSLEPRWNRQVFLLPSFSIFRNQAHTIWHTYMAQKPWHFHREGARGLVADYYAMLDSVGWRPTSKPELSMTASTGRDLFKQALATISRNFLPSS